MPVFLSLNVPTKAGFGVQLDVSGLTAEKDFVVSGSFDGYLYIQGSEDGATWKDYLQFTGGAQTTFHERLDVYLKYVRTRRAGSERLVTAPTVTIGADYLPGTTVSVAPTLPASHLGRAYALAMTYRTIPATEAFVWWLRNDYADFDLIIDGGNHYWNGGNTNHNRCLLLRAYGSIDAFSVPTANHTAPIFIPNKTSVTPLPGPHTGYVWNGTGGGMTLTGSVGTEYQLLTEQIFAQGCTHLGNENWILEPGEVAIVSMQGEEVGVASMEFLFHYEPR